MARFILILMVVMFGATGCLGGAGGLGGKKPTTTTTSASAAPPAVTMPSYEWPPRPDSQVVRANVESASRVLATGMDLPQGWVALDRPRTEISTGSMTEQAVQCSFGPSPSPLSAYVVGSTYFQKETDTVLTTFVRVTSGQAGTAEDFANFTPERVSQCIKGTYELQHKPQTGVVVTSKFFGEAPPGEVKFSAVTPPAADDIAIAFRGDVIPTDQRRTFMDIYAIGFGSFEVVLVARSHVGALSEPVAAKVLAKVADRTKVEASARG